MPVGVRKVIVDPLVERSQVYYLRDNSIDLFLHFLKGQLGGSFSVFFPSSWPPSLTTLLLLSTFTLNSTDSSMTQFPHSPLSPLFRLLTRLLQTGHLPKLEHNSTADWWKVGTGDLEGSTNQVSELVTCLNVLQIPVGATERLENHSSLTRSWLTVAASGQNISANF